MEARALDCLAFLGLPWFYFGCAATWVVLMQIPIFLRATNRRIIKNISKIISVLTKIRKRIKMIYDNIKVLAALFEAIFIGIKLR